MLLRPFEPGFERLLGYSIGPVLVALACGRVHHTGDVARAREHESDGTAQQLSSEGDGARRRDVILAGSEMIDRDKHLAEVEGR
jgi:hypothetical protein